MKKLFAILLCATICISQLAGVVFAQETEQTNDKAVRIQFTPANYGQMTPSAEAVWDAVNKGDQAIITIYNNGTEDYSLYLRTVDASWGNQMNSVTATIKAGSAAQIHCGVKETTAKAILFAVDQTKTGDLTICNLTSDQAQAIKTAFDATTSYNYTLVEIIDNPEITPVVYEIYPESLPEVDGGSLLITSRTHRCAGPKQDLVDVLNKNGTGTYFFSGNFRLLDDEYLTEAQTRGVNFCLGVYVKTDTGYSKYYLGNNTKVNAGDWTLFTHAAEFAWEGEVTEAYMFIQTVYADKPSSASSDDYMYPGSIELDAFSLNKASTENGVVFGENLLLNPDCDPGRVSAAAGWTTNLGSNYAQMVNTQEYNADFTARENADGTMTYPNGCVPLTDKNIYYSGRWVDLEDGSKQASFESYVELNFTGTSVRATSVRQIIVYVQIDGGKVKEIYLRKNGTVLAENLLEGTHKVKIFATQQTARPTISGFFIDEGASTVPSKVTKKIEFIGDSIMEGYVRPEDKAQDIANNSVLNSYGYKTGVMLEEKYNMGFNIVAFGGIGISKRAEQGTNYDHLTMPERYFKEREYLKATDRNAVVTAKIKEWDTTKYVPDYVVINLGTNDARIDSSKFKKDYDYFLNKLLKTYENAVFFVMTPFNKTKQEEIKEVVTTVNSERVVLIDSAVWGISGGSDNTHPSAASHDAAAQKLFEVLSAYIDQNDTDLNPDGVLPSSTPEGTNENKMFLDETGYLVMGAALTALVAGAVTAIVIAKKRKKD